MAFTKLNITRFLCSLLEIAALAWVALWNHYPVLFFDTGWYLHTMMSGPPDDQKTPFYPLFMELSGGIFSLWGVVAAQAVLTWYVIASFLRAMELSQARWAVVLLLCATTSVSWEVSYIMPDVFSALQVLPLFLLLFRRQGLNRIELMALAVIYMLSNIVHHSNYLLSASLLLVVFIAAWLWPVLPLRRLILPCLLTLASLCALATANYAYTGSVYLSKTSHAYIVARMVEDGIVPKLLAEHCSEKHYALCPYAKEIPARATEFLFGRDIPYAKPTEFLFRRDIDNRSVLDKVGGWEHSKAALMPVIMDSLRYYPMENIKAAFKETMEQLGLFDIADFVFQFTPQHYVVKQLQIYSPREYERWSASLQQQGELKSNHIALFNEAMMALYVLLGIAVVWSTRGRESYYPLKQALSFMLAAIVVNAAITGTFSHAECRYESRLIWLIPLCVMAMIARRIRCCNNNVTKINNFVTY